MTESALVKRGCFAAAAIMITASLAAAGDLTFALGVFRFYATDYYFPNFYDEVGARGELAYTTGEGNISTYRFQAQGYPMDDNIFDPSFEYAYRRPLSWRGWSFIFEPAAGFQYTKLQYPVPYYAVVEHHFLPWLRIGADAGVGRALFGPFSVSARYRGRLLYYLGGWHGAFARAKGGEPAQWLNAPFGQFDYRVRPTFSVFARGGIEAGGYYKEIFIKEKSRPYVEAGVAYSH